uniref:Fungal lipase-type domain-containing protein n=1 Tax=Kalanchoe fedtschenkoi TaxID=63787 RepID=A0A7N0RDM9_KALFE
MAELRMTPTRQAGKGRRSSKRAWKLSKLLMAFRLHTAKSAATAKRHRFQLSCLARMSHQLTPLHPVATISSRTQPDPIPSRPSLNIPKNNKRLLIKLVTSSNFANGGASKTPTWSPKEPISAIWRELHGSDNWSNLLDPLHPALRREIVKYGEFCEATYDAFDKDPLSEFCGSCIYTKHTLFENLNLSKHGYKVTKLIYAMSPVDVPHWFDREHAAETWCKDSNWMGYVAVSSDEETQRIGRRDITVAWRGTAMPCEWFADIRTGMARFDEDQNVNVKVAKGFLSIFRSKSDASKFNKMSASEQVMKEVLKQVNIYKSRGQDISLTATGHSLGGALALLTAYQAAKLIPNIFVSVISFAAPRLGNIAFKERLAAMGVHTLRVVVKQDIVPRLPGFEIYSLLTRIDAVARKFHWMYRHVGVQLRLDTSASPYLKDDFDLTGYHNLEIYLHLVDGYHNKLSQFRTEARRDLALVNKSTDMLLEKLRIPERWYQAPNKGLVCNSFGRWVKPKREAHDLDLPSPSPLAIEPATTTLLKLLQQDRSTGASNMSQLITL